MFKSLHGQIVSLDEQIRKRMDEVQNRWKLSKRFIQQQKTQQNFSALDSKSKKLVFVNDKNWNIVTTMITGIYKSISMNASDKYSIPTKGDFKIHNKLEIEAVFSTAFNRCKFKDFAPHVFQSIRQMFGIQNETYIKSIGVDTLRNNFFDKLSLMLSENSSGKSGSFFFHTFDAKFMVKTIHKSEFQILLQTLNSYYTYLQNYPQTLLTRYFGLHELKCYNDTTLVYDIFIVVMNNVFDLDDPDSIREKYDLKGSTYQRITSEKHIERGCA